MDVLLLNGNKEVKFEVKLGSLDINGYHQFNGIRHDTGFTHLFLLGVSPDELKYEILAKRDLDNYNLVRMQSHKILQHLNFHKKMTILNHLMILKLKFTVYLVNLLITLNQ